MGADLFRDIFSEMTYTFKLLNPWILNMFHFFWGKKPLNSTQTCGLKGFFVETDKTLISRKPVDF